MNKRELIEPGKFYYHRRLRIMPLPPSSYIGRDGKVYYTNEEKEWYLEMVKSFTDQDLLDYFCTEFFIELDHPDDIKQFKGALNYLVNRYGLDLVLFTIDYLVDQIISGLALPPHQPLDIKTYIPIVEELYEEKKAEEKAAGIDHVVPRNK
jgi:hypothetical protein